MVFYLLITQLVPTFRSTAFYSIPVLGIEGLAWGLPGGYLGVPRVLALETPSNPPLNAQQTPVIVKTSLDKA